MNAVNGYTPEPDMDRVFALAKALKLDCGQRCDYLVIDGQPHSKARPRFSSSGKVYNPKKQRASEYEIGLRLRRVFKTPVRHNVGIVCLFYRRTAARVDVDNMLKNVMDAANGIVWEDDMQVTAQTGIVEVDRENPRTVLLVGAHQTSMQRPSQGPISCVWCGTLFTQQNSRSRYCSQHCVGQANIAKAQKLTRKCKHCGAAFNPRNFKQLYCRNTCMQMAHKHRKRKKEASL